MNSDAPFISILIPAYNRPELLLLAIRSVLANSFQDFEIIVSDDRSPRRDEVIAALESFATESRLCWFVQPTNLGWSKNRNFLLAKARGRLVWLMGDDDLLPPDALERLARFVKKHPDRDIYACAYEVINETGRHLYARSAGKELLHDWSDRFALRQLLRSQVLPFWLFHPFTFAYRRELGVRFPYREQAYIGDDLFFLFECAAAGKSIAISPEVMFSWRKFSPLTAKSPHAQINLSSDINGIRARARICDLIEATPPVRNLVLGLFPDGDFVQRFLHDSVRSGNNDSHNELLARIISDPELGPRFKDYHNPHPGRARLKIRLYMIYAFLRLTGPEGLLQLIRRTWREHVQVPDPTKI